ncbi:glycine/betaine ABC transporter substrate-binding protein [Streptomyces sp. MUSC 14]|uniref:ABC transporter substrate-binding protein n=1 Tax=Streptomyces sp. MUSC 14 TaxID=1354889 RepID=UPI0008F5DB48|nr:ABC transporter substrate-binding protein [Streptomyces sp. MUSC 14]OIK00840.1 glycine/betaine ABC transporter substrate-binding protein [Streptomyces sp. MUSC 14]
MARHWRTGAAGLTLLCLTLTSCAGAKVSDMNSSGSKRSDGTCGTFNLAVNPWIGYEADAAVVAYVAQHDLGCTVTKKDLKEEIAWQGFGTGEVDAVLENWGHDDLKKKYMAGQKTAVEAGSTGNRGVIGWYVPPWLARAHPDILDWKNLDKYADRFKTSESGGKGQLLDGDPSYVTNDAALVKNLKLNFKVVYAGSETALIQAFRTAEKNKQWMIGYFYEPQWFMSEVQLVKVNLPTYTTGCDADAAKVACDYPVYDLDKIVSKQFAASGSPAYRLVKNFHWTNDDQNAVARYIAQDKMSDDAAARKWVDANRDKVDAWLK